MVGLGGKESSTAGFWSFAGLGPPSTCLKVATVDHRSISIFGRPCSHERRMRTTLCLLSLHRHMPMTEGRAAAPNQNVAGCTWQPRCGTIQDHREMCFLLSPLVKLGSICASVTQLVVHEGIDELACSAARLELGASLHPAVLLYCELTSTQLNLPLTSGRSYTH